LLKDGESMLTFAEFPALPSTNTAAVRLIRLAVLMRKVSNGIASEAGAKSRAILISIHPTLKVWGIDPFAAMRTALKTVAETGTRSPLPEQTSTDG
jgi:hypothetical protein